MATLDRQVSLRERIVRFIDMNEPELVPCYKPGEVVSLLYQIHIPPAGRVLRVPMNTAVVLNLGNGELMSIGAENQFLDLPAGIYTFKCVDLLVQQLRQLEARDSTQDGLQVALKLDVYFKVVDAIKAVAMPELRLRLASAVKEVASDLIRSVKHDALIQVHNSAINTFSSEVIVGHMLNALGRHNISQVVQVVEIFVLERAGDKQRMTTLQRSYQEALEIEQARQIAFQHSLLEKTQLEIRDGLIETHADVDTKEAIAAQRTVEEQEKARLVKAGITRDEQNILLDVARQKAELEMEIERMRMAHERDMKELELNKTAMIELAKAICQSQNGTVGRAPDPVVIQALAQALNTMARPTLDGHALPQPGNGKHVEDLRVTKSIDSDKNHNGHDQAKEKQAGKGD